MSTHRVTARVTTRARGALALLAGALALAACSPDVPSSPTVRPAFPSEERPEPTNEFDRASSPRPAPLRAAPQPAAAVRATPDA